MFEGNTKQETREHQNEKENKNMKKTMKKVTGTIAVLAAAAMMAAVPAFASTDLMAEPKITMEQAEQTALSAKAGTITKVELKDKKDTATYEVTVTGSDGKETEVEINAATGAVSMSETKTKASKEDKTALKEFNQTLKTKWSSYTAEQKEQVYALKDAEFDAQISEINSEVASGYKTQAEADQVIADINSKKTKMRTSGDAPGMKNIVTLP
jgi:uncharacterized membrane protein YkoI